MASTHWPARRSDTQRKLSVFPGHSTSLSSHLKSCHKASKDLGQLLDSAAGAAREASTYLQAVYKLSSFEASNSLSKSSEPLFGSTLNLSKAKANAFQRDPKGSKGIERD